MQIFPNQLEVTLSEGLRPIYVIGGSEYVLQEMARDCIIGSVQQVGVDGLTVHHADEVKSNSAKDGIWYQVLDELKEESLFGSSQLIEVRTTASVFASKGWTHIQAYAVSPSEKNILLIWLSDVDYREKRKSWYSDLRKSREVVFIVADELNRKEFVLWVKQVATDYGFSLDSAAAEKLAAYCEGNLLAAKQELDVLNLVSEPGTTIGINDLQLTDSSTSESFDLLDAVCRGDINRVGRLFESVRRQPNWRGNVDLGILRFLSGVLSLTLQSYSDRQVTIPAYQRNRVESLKRRLERERIARLLTECAQINSIALGMARGEVRVLLKGLLYAVAGYGNSTLERDFHWRYIDRSH